MCIGTQDDSKEKSIYRLVTAREQMHKVPQTLLCNCAVGDCVRIATVADAQIICKTSDTSESLLPSCIVEVMGQCYDDMHRHVERERQKVKAIIFFSLLV